MLKDQRSLLPRHGIIDLIPGLRDLPDSTKYLIASFSVIVLTALGIVVFLILKGG